MGLTCVRCGRNTMAQFEEPVCYIFGNPHCPRCTEKYEAEEDELYRDAVEQYKLAKEKINARKHK